MKKQKMLSFQGKQEIKDLHIARLQAHYNADEIVQGQYWENGKGCDTGCSFHSADHSQWETQLGIPRIIGKIRDRIFEGLSNKDAKEFPLECSNATPVGVDLKNVWKLLFVWMLSDKKDGVINLAKTEEQKKIIQSVSDLLLKSTTETVTKEEFLELYKSAKKIADAAYAAAAAAAADSAYAAYAAADAAYAAAADAAYAAAAAAYAAADSAYAAYATAYAAADKKGYYKKMKNKLIELLKSSK